MNAQAWRVHTVGSGAKFGQILILERVAIRDVREYPLLAMEAGVDFSRADCSGADFNGTNLKGHTPDSTDSPR